MNPVYISVAAPNIIKGGVRMRLLKTATLLLAGVAIHSVAVADVILLGEGKQQAGVIIKDVPGDRTVTIRTASGDIAIPRDKITGIQKESAADSYARIGDQHFARNDFGSAMAAFSKAAELDPKNTTVTEKLREVEAALAGDAAAKEREALKRIDEMIAQAVQLARDKKFEEAAQVLRTADPGENSPKTGPYRRAYAEAYMLWGMDRLDRQDFSGAQDKLQLALKLDPKNDSIRQQLAKVWEGDPTKLEEVVQFYKASNLPEDQLKVADAQFKLRNYEAALPVYLKYLQDPKFASPTMRQRVTLMFDMLHRQFAEKGDYAKAIEVYRLFLEYSPDEDPGPIAKYEYMLRMSKIDKSDATSRADLALFAEKQGMTDTAKQEYANVLTIAPDNKLASEGLRRFAEADLQDARDFFSEQQYLLSVQKARDVEREFTVFPDVVKQAQELVAKSEIEQQKVAKNAQQQAIALALRGDDYFNQALAYIASYTSSNVNPNTRVFSPKVEATKYLQRALYAWRQALQIDPSLGAPTSYDLHNKIADAYAKYAVLANPNPPRLPTRDNSRLKRGRDVRESR
jgi:tetratricopeptide (TPR) repeat protein